MIMKKTKINLQALIMGLGPLCFLWVSCSHKIIHRPVPFDDDRLRLSLEYMDQRYGIQQEYPHILPTMVVVHWTAINSLERSWKAFEGSRLPGSREAIKGASLLNVSAHYLIDRDGTIYRLMPDTLFARHVIGLNHCAIGIENIGSDAEPLTDEQLKANTFLIKHLADKFPIEYVIGHHEYTAFRSHKLWKEKDPNYLTSKTDPGDEFMGRLRKRLSSLGIKGPPN